MKAVIYARHSNPTNQDEAIENQLLQCREYAENNGIEVVEEYVDRGLSAITKKETRPEFLRMINDCRKRRFDTILVSSLDRITRHIDELRHYGSILIENEVKIIAMKEIVAGIPMEDLDYIVCSDLKDSDFEFEGP